ncbi:MAG: hypothetical protein AABY61_15775, partial [Nitrospirota bacterium]
KRTFLLCPNRTLSFWDYRPDRCSLRWIHFTKGLKRRVRIAVCDRIRRIAEDDAVVGVEGIVGSHGVPTPGEE